MIWRAFTLESGRPLTLIGAFLAAKRRTEAPHLDQLFTVAAAPPGKPAEFVRPFEPDAAYGVFVGPPVQPLAPKPERLLPGRE
jgi:hypothetical protein